MKKKQIELTGKLVTGQRKAAFFTQLDWVQRQCVEKLGFAPFPGTLNLEFTSDDLTVMEEIMQMKGAELLPPDTDFCAAKIIPISIKNVIGAIVVPADGVTIHKENIVEILSGEHLRQALGLVDGDVVTIKFETGESL